MPCGMADRRPPGGWAGSPWAETVTQRIGAVLCAARVSGHANLVLGAFGCGAFGNPAAPVAAIFREQLASPEFRGCFERVVFAIIDPMGTGNLKPFQSELASIGHCGAMEADEKHQAVQASRLLFEQRFPPPPPCGPFFSPYPGRRKKRERFRGVGAPVTKKKKRKQRCDNKNSEKTT
eukprot:NODE_17744_length_927_cov_7.697500.p2 GENE.NODE_17744_length_927_cov_7.697500~~NODE_17744_length_927_cov_7.697500.p2  ORF type:complete len:178 (+),score=39.34 NODE_17744_length_927_cov_7.697500:394-927(+)